MLPRTLAEAKSDQLALLAAGVAFFGLLALVPALAALVSVYGYVANPAHIARDVGDLLSSAPGEVRDLIREQLQRIASGSDARAGIGALVGLAIALWSASSGMKHLIDALNAAYDEDEGRGFAKVRGLSLLITVGAVVFLVLAFVGVAVVPALVEGPLSLIRWPLLGLFFIAALTVLYRSAPSRDAPQWRWASPGALVATVLWLIGSGLFSLYVSNFSHYGETYGSLGSIVVLMLWLFLTTAVVLFGAELNAELERQTRRDTTHGPEKPMGERRATAADTIGPTAAAVKEERRRRREAANSD